MCKRLFVDMDGTLAEFPTDRSYFEKGFFESLKPYAELVSMVNRIHASRDDVEVYLLTCCPEESENPFAGAEKTSWAAQYLPGVPIILLPCGKVKAKAVYELTGRNVCQEDILLDDYSVNLRAWENAGGLGVKALNSKNGTNGTWTGLRVDVFRPSELDIILQR